MKERFADSPSRRAGLLRCYPYALGLVAVILALGSYRMLSGPPPHTRTVKHNRTKAVPEQDIDYWTSAKKEVDRNVMDMLTQDQQELQAGVRRHKLMHGDKSRKEIAITFDDGPHPNFTPKLLAILNKYHAKATFFLVGEKAQQYPYLVKQEVAAGNCIGNHTYHHVNLTRTREKDVALEIQACNDVLERITGRQPHMFRPPGGDYNNKVAQVAEALDYTMVLWTDDPGDYASPGDKVIETRLLDRIGNGGIILIHDGIQQTVDVLPQIITYLHSKGYTLVTVDQMMAHMGRSSSDQKKEATRRD